MSTTDLTQLDPPEIDRLWTEAMQPAYQAWANLAETRKSIRRYERHGYRREAGSRNRVPEYLLERETELKAKYEEAVKASEPFDAEYERRGGWTRYLIVSNSNGHVHRSWRGTDSPCHTLVPGQTLVQPLWQLSGRDDDGVVSEFGSTACTKCFPDAPVGLATTPESQGYCSGSGKNLDPNKPSRTGFAAGNSGICPDCGAVVTLTTRYGPKLRKHKPKV